MAHIVDLPNGQQAEFPDEMGADQISSIIQKQFPVTNMEQSSSNESPNLFQMKPSLNRLADIPGMTDPKELAKGALQSAGLIGTAFVPEIPAIMRGGSLLASAINTLSKMGAGAGIGAISSPDNPLAGGIVGGTLGSIPSAFRLGKGIMDIGKNAFTRIIPEEIGKAVQAGHDLLKKSAEDIFEMVGQKVKERNIPLFPIKNEIIDDISVHLPKTEATDKLLSDARSGNYQALRDLQTELFERGTKAKNSTFPSESNKGEEMLDLRNKINKTIFNHLKQTGHSDLAESLADAMSKYRNLIKTYYAKKLSPAIKNMVHEESREIPKNIGELMNVDSVPIERIIKHNPSVFDLAQQYSKNKNALKKLKYIGAGLGGLGIVGGLANIPGAIGKVRDIFSE